jgi:putative hydrolase
LKLAKKYGFKLAINSDAHFYDRIGEYSTLNFIFESKDFDSDLIINSTAENMIEYLEKRKRRLSEFKKTV